MNKNYLGEILRVPIRLEDSDGNDVTLATASALEVYFAYESDDAFDLLTPSTPTDYTLEELSRGQYWLRIAAAINIKAENYQIVVKSVSGCSVVFVEKRYSGHVELKTFRGSIVHVNYSGAAGTAWPKGTETDPVNSLSNAWSIATANKLSKMLIQTKNNLMGISDDQGDYMELEGVTSPGVVGSGGLSMTGTRYGVTYKNLGLKRADTSHERYPTLLNCVIKEGDFRIDQGLIKDSLVLSGRSILPSIDGCSIVNTKWESGDLDVVNAADQTYDLIKTKGDLTIKNLDTGGVINIFGHEGKLVIDSTCDNGTINVYGKPASYTDNHTGGCTVNVYAANGLTPQEVRDSMKLAPTGNGPAAGSVDKHLDDIQAKTDGLQFTQAGLVDSNLQRWQNVLPFGLAGQLVQVKTKEMETDVITAAALKADAVAEIQSGLGLEASVQAVKAKTDNLPSDPASESNVSAVGAAVLVIDGKVDLVKVKTDKLTFNAANRILSDLREVNDVDITLSDLSGLTRAQYVDFFNKEVLSRSGEEPSQYKLGTGGNAETIDVDHVVIGTKKKADKETVV